MRRAMKRVSGRSARSDAICATSVRFNNKTLSAASPMNVARAFVMEAKARLAPKTSTAWLYGDGAGIASSWSTSVGGSGNGGKKGIQNERLKQCFT